MGNSSSGVNAFVRHIISYGQELLKSCISSSAGDSRNDGNRRETTNLMRGHPDMSWWKLFKNRQLSSIEALLKRAIKNQEGLMGILNDLKTAVADIAADAMEAHDEVLVAIEHIMREVDMEDHPDLKAAVESLRDSHASFSDSIKTLKEKVDEVMASGGPAG